MVPRVKATQSAGLSFRRWGFDSLYRRSDSGFFPVGNRKMIMEENGYGN